MQTRAILESRCFSLSRAYLGNAGVIPSVKNDRFIFYKNFSVVPNSLLGSVLQLTKSQLGKLHLISHFFFFFFFFFF